MASGAENGESLQRGIRLITLQLNRPESEAYGDALADKEFIVRRGGTP